MTVDLTIFWRRRSTGRTSLALFNASLFSTTGRQTLISVIAEYNMAPGNCMCVILGDPKHGGCPLGLPLNRSPKWHPQEHKETQHCPWIMLPAAFPPSDRTGVLTEHRQESGKKGIALGASLASPSKPCSRRKPRSLSMPRLAGSTWCSGRPRSGTPHRGRRGRRCTRLLRFRRLMPRKMSENP